VNAHDTYRALEFIVPNLKSSKQNGMKFLVALQDFMDNLDLSKNDSIAAFAHRFEISKYAREFEQMLQAELSVEPCYMLTPKGGYNVSILTDRPEEAFHPDLLKFIPEAYYDMQQAAKCLAFELPTAAAFHLHKLIERCVHAYWDAVSEGQPRLERSSTGAYLKIMTDDKIGDVKVLSILRQINLLHRNPLVSPDVQLQTWEAVELFGIVSSVISAMMPSIKISNDKEYEEVENRIISNLARTAS
jgi:hypothetical protein